MPRGLGHQVRVHYKGESDDFVVFVESGDALRNWTKDKSIPLAQVVDGWGVYVTHKQGNQGKLDGASNASLENEFGTSKGEEVIKIILEKGVVQETPAAERVGDTNMVNGGLVRH